MKQKLVYRMEQPDGRGAYQGAPDRTMDRISEVMMSRGPIEVYPAPYEDGIFPPSEDYVCGARNAAQLKHWFPQDAVPLVASYGNELTVWKVPADHVIEGSRQVMFDRRCAECIERRPAADLWADQQARKAA